MAKNQLTLLLKFEQEKEQKAAQALQAAEQEYQQHKLRLQNVNDYRLEYMKRVSQRSIEGIDSATYGHYHAFVKKLENAGEQMRLAIKQAQGQIEQCKKRWLEQRQKVQAVETLQKKEQARQAIALAKQEQKMFDEIATQQFVRKQM